MPRSKQNKQNKGAGKDKDGKHRKETKEERKLRLKQQEEAREACLKLLPMVGGGILVLLIVFALWVRSVPPKEISTLSAADSLLADSLADSLLKQPQFQGDVPDFVNVNSEPLVKEALNEAQEILNNRDLENNNEDGGGSGSGDDKENIETIEL